MGAGAREVRRPRGLTSVAAGPHRSGDERGDHVREETTEQHDEAVVPEVENAGADEAAIEGVVEAEGIQHPAKVMRIAAMCRTLLDELRSQASLDEPSRARLREIY